MSQMTKLGNDISQHVADHTKIIIKWYYYLWGLHGYQKGVAIYVYYRIINTIYNMLGYCVTSIISHLIYIAVVHVHCILSVASRNDTVIFYLAVMDAIYELESN